MIFYNTNKPVVFNLDDFCEEIMSSDLWKLIFELKDAYPNIKITMFTIPLLCSKDWLEMVTEEFPWIEMHYHGTDHKDRNEWIGKRHVDLPFSEYFFRGFKAPWWRMDQVTADAFNDAGYLISACKGHFDVRGDRVYRYNDGTMRLPRIWYEHKYCHAVHSHVQPQKTHDGLPDGNVLENLSKAFPKDAKFMFVSELF